MVVVRYRPEVADDLRSAVRWYDEKRKGLGDDFLIEFWRSIDAISERPLSFGVSVCDIRACRLRRFPYIIRFRLEPTAEEVIVFAVMFGGRDTSAWIDRVQ